MTTQRTATVHSLPRPGKVTLSVNAKQAINSSELAYGATRYLNIQWAADPKVVAELAGLALIFDTWDTSDAISTRWNRRYQLTADGDRLFAWFRHQNHLGQLAKQMRTEGVTGEDIADVAASIDAGEETGTVFGVSVDFQLAFALAASLAGQSAEDLRQDLNQYMG